MIFGSALNVLSTMLKIFRTVLKIKINTTFKQSCSLFKQLCIHVLWLSVNTRDIPVTDDDTVLEAGHNMMAC